MKVHIFDIDHTLLKGSTAFYFLAEALKEKLFPRRLLLGFPIQWLLYKLAVIDPQFIEKKVEFLAALDKGKIEALVKKSFQNRTRKKIYVQAKALMDDLKSRGGRVIFATSSFHILVEPLKGFFGVSEVLASRLEFREGETTGRTAGDALFGVKKKNAVAAWLEENRIAPSEAAFYSDSYNDLPLLEFCGTAVAVNPDRRLAREARRRGWQVLRFEETLGDLPA